jgi:hypothetical protein
VGAAYLLVLYFLALGAFVLAGWIKSWHKAFIVTLLVVIATALWGLLSEAFTC